MAVGLSSTGGSNIAIGNGAGNSLTTGFGNTFVGTGVTGSVYPAGYYVTTGNKNTILGNYSGNQNGLNLTTASNYIVLSDGDGNPRGWFDSSGNFNTIRGSGSTTQGIVLVNDNGGGVSFVDVIHKSGVGSGAYYAAFDYGGGNIGNITQSGTTGVLYNITSDQRLKENIVDAPDASSDIDAIQVRSFDFISDKSPVKYGFIAQELVTVAPYAVHQPQNPNETMGVDYSKLVPMMLKEIQSLRKRITTLEVK